MLISENKGRELIEGSCTCLKQNLKGFGDWKTLERSNSYWGALDQRPIHGTCMVMTDLTISASLMCYEVD